MLVQQILSKEKIDYCENVHKEGDYLIMLYCPKIMGIDEGLGQLGLEEGRRFRKDAEMIETKLKEKKLDGKVEVGGAGIPAGEAIVEISKKENASLIILGARRLGKGLQKGGTTKRYVIRNAKVPVLVCKHAKYKGDKKKARKGVKRVVIAGSDGQMHANQALKYYKENLYKEGDFLLLAYIPVARQVDTETADIQVERQALYTDDAELLKDFIDGELEMPGEVLIEAQGATAGDTILAVAEREGADLIVIGSRGLAAGAYEARARTSDIVVNNSEVSVFVNKY